MKTFSAELKRYMLETLDVKIDLRQWSGQSRLPIYLAKTFHFREALILGQPCLFMFEMDAHSTPANIRKFWEQVSSHFSGITIYVQSKITAYDRKRLIGQKIPFIVPAKQLYIPQLGIELREHFQKMHSGESQFLSPAAQTVIIYALLKKVGEKANPTYLSKILGFTPMTISRVFDEFAVANIGVIQKVGKERRWMPAGTQYELWVQAKPKMRSPIKKNMWVNKVTRSVQPKIIAGLSALSHYSSLNPPSTAIYAIDNTIWAQWKRAGVKESSYPYEAQYCIQIWYYNPALFSDKNIVDPFSLYLSFEETKDERIEIALEEMMRRIKW